MIAIVYISSQWEWPDRGDCGLGRVCYGGTGCTNSSSTAYFAIGNDLVAPRRDEHPAHWYEPAEHEQCQSFLNCGPCGNTACHRKRTGNGILAAQHHHSRPLRSAHVRRVRMRKEIA